MTVKDLRDTLATLPDDMRVVHAHDGTWDTARGPRGRLGVFVVTLWPCGSDRFTDDQYDFALDETTPPVDLAIVAFEDDARYLGRHPCRAVTP